MIESGVEYLRSVEADFLSSEVLLRRSDGQEIRLRAVPGRTVFRSTNDYGHWTRIESRDFIVRADALVVPPDRGDVIVFRDREYEVLAPNDEPVWGWSDPFHTAYRIHTKHTGGNP